MVHPRYFLWVSYNGSRFPEMAKGLTKMGVVDVLEKVISYVVSDSFLPIVRCSPSSRTDVGVHSLRNAIMMQVPNEYDINVSKEEFLKKVNSTIDMVNQGSMKILDYEKLVPGFCMRKHVSHRIYTYRLAIAKSYDIYENFKNSPTIVCTSEKNYAHILPPGFDIGKAQEACNIFLGNHNLASFYKHKQSSKNKEIRLGVPFINTMRTISFIEVGIGRPKIFNNDLYDYINITIIARSFLREQIRRMVSVITGCAYGTMKTSIIKYLIDNPNPANFHNLRIHVAPPQGLYLTDVVYDPSLFTKPIPYYYDLWDLAEWDNELKEWIDHHTDQSNELC